MGINEEYNRYIDEQFQKGLISPDYYRYMKSRPFTGDDRVRMEQIMRKAVPDHPELIYAFRKTGRIVSTRNKDKLSPEDLKEWEDAILEYYQQQKRLAVYARCSIGGTHVS